MADMSVTADGVERLAASLDAAAATLGDLTSTNKAAGDLVVLGAHVPRVTGALEASVLVEATAAGVTVTAGGPAAPYAPFVHARDPFLTTALAAREDAVVELYLTHLVDVVDTIEGA